MILGHEQVDTEWYFFFSEGSNSPSKIDLLKFINLPQFTYLQPDFYINRKDENIINIQ